MKKLNKSSETIRNFDELISKFSENEILDIKSMINIRGGDPDGDGSTPILIPPK